MLPVPTVSIARAPGNTADLPGKLRVFALRILERLQEEARKNHERWIKLESRRKKARKWISINKGVVPSKRPQMSEKGVQLQVQLQLIGKSASDCHCEC